MAALDFPDSPAVGDTYGSASTIWRWDGTAWQSTAGVSGAKGRVGYAQVTANITGIGLPPTDVATASFTAVAGRTYRVTGEIYVSNGVGGAAETVTLTILNGVTQVQSAIVQTWTANQLYKMYASYVTSSLSAGAQTFKLTLNRGASATGGLTVQAAVSYPSYLLVEDITYEAGATTGGGSSGSGLEAAKPVAPNPGTRYFATDTKRDWLYDGTGWIIMREPWTTYTPATTGITLGTGGTVTGRYQRDAGFADLQCIVVLGTGGTLTGGAASFSVPFALGDHTNGKLTGGYGRAGFDNYAAASRWIAAGDTTIAFMHPYPTSLNYTFPFRLAGSGAPWAWAVNDSLNVEGRLRLNTPYS